MPVFGSSWRMAVVVSFALLCGTTPCLRGQSVSADEYEIRAAMLFNLTRFIEWPAAKLDPTHPEFVICVLGSDPLGVSLDNLARNKSVGSKPIAVRHLSSVAGAHECHILYVSAGGDKLKTYARASGELAKAGVLSVSARANADSPDQVIGLPTVEQRVHIDVNLGAAERSGLTISSKLLHLATVSR